MLPLHARRAILAHWRASPNPFCPTIEMLLSWSSQETFTSIGGHEVSEFVAFGQCGRRVHELRFWAVAIDAMPDDVVPLIVAHELSHVFAWAIGNHANEKIDRANLKLWGVDQLSLDRWIRNSSLTKLERIANKHVNRG
jgi:predicted SprT family Zn-dependent metalloprotease